MPKMKLGAAFYALIAAACLLGAVLAVGGHGTYAAADQWYRFAIGATFLLTGVMFGIGAVTRRGLLSDDGPWICRRGWIVLLALVGAEFVMDLIGDSGPGLPYPHAVSVFVPSFVKRLQEKYYEGRAEAERALSSGERGGGPSRIG